MSSGRTDRSYRNLLERRWPAAALVGTLAIGLLLLGVIGARVWRLKQSADKSVVAAPAQEQHIEYFSQFSRRRGEPVGICPITEAEAYTFPRAFRFVRTGDIVERVELINARFLEDDELNFTSLMGSTRQGLDIHREAGRQFIRNDQGQLVREDVFDPAGQLLWSLEYPGSNSAVFMDHRGKLNRVEVSGKPLRMKVAWDEHGWLREFRFIDEQGERVAGPDGTFGARLHHSTSGLITKLEQLGRQGELVSSEGSPPIWKVSYDEKARFTGLSYYDEQEQPTHSEGYHRWQRDYNDDGGVTTFHLLEGHAFQVSFERGKAGKKEMVKKIGRPGNGETILESLAGLPEDEGRTHWLAARCFHATVRRVYSEQGRIAERWVRHAAGSANHALETTATRVLSDARGNVVELTNLDRHGQPRFDPAVGFTRVRALYEIGGLFRESVVERQDEFGKWVTLRKANSALNLTEISEYSGDGKSITDKYGVHRREYTYDAHQNKIDERYFGVDGKPVVHASFGVHRLASEYDDQNRRIARRSFDREGNPAISQDMGSHRWADRLDDNGRLLERIHYGTDDRPIKCRAGFARQTNRYLENGELQEKSYWIVDPSGEFTLSKREDGRGRLVDALYYTSTGVPENNRFGYHRERRRYDRNLFVDVTYFDVLGKPAFDSVSGCNGRIDTFDDKGRRIQEIYLDDLRKPMNNKRGFAKGNYAFNDAGQWLEMSEWSVNQAGEFVLKRRMDGTGRILESADFSSDGSAERFSQNLAYRAPGSAFPKATASHTHSVDQVERANDGIVNYERSVLNRWTSFESTNPTDWLELEFERDTTFGHVELAIYDEGSQGGVQTPQSYTVESWNGERWLEIPNQKRSPEMPTGNQWNEVRFEKVTARKVRVVFTHAGQARSGITEIAIWP